MPKVTKGKAIKASKSASSIATSGISSKKLTIIRILLTPMPIPIENPTSPLRYSFFIG